jgi:hypothetical protein
MEIKKLLLMITIISFSYSTEKIPTFLVNFGYQNALHEQSFSAMRGPEIGYYPKGFIFSAGFGFSGLNKRVFDRLTIDAKLHTYLVQDYSEELKEQWHVYTVGFGPTFKKKLNFFSIDFSLFMGGMAQFGYMEITGEKMDNYCFLCNPDSIKLYQTGDKVSYATRTGASFDGKISKSIEVGLLAISPFISLGFYLPFDATDTWYPPLTLAEITGGVSFEIKTKKGSH